MSGSSSRFLDRNTTMSFENLCQVCQERSAPYKCPKCQIKYCSLLCYRDSFHARCTRKFDESEIFDSMNIDGDDDDDLSRANSATTSNDFVRGRIEDILKRKLEEKDFHNEQDDEQMEEFFEHMLPSKDLGDYRQVGGTRFQFEVNDVSLVELEKCGHGRRGRR